jgi:hypothetical protein
VGQGVAGIRVALGEGFRVRVAATLPYEQSHQLTPFHTFLDSLGIAREDQVIRALAHRGVADAGIELTIESLIPEVTVTADGVYWHPVSADHDDQLSRATSSHWLQPSPRYGSASPDPRARQRRSPVVPLRLRSDWKGQRGSHGRQQHLEAAPRTVVGDADRAVWASTSPRAIARPRPAPTGSGP